MALYFLQAIPQTLALSLSIALRHKKGASHSRAGLNGEETVQPASDILPPELGLLSVQFEVTTFPCIK